MRALVLALRIAGGCWFWVFVLVALAGLFVDTNVATGRISWGSRLASAALGLAFAVPGLLAWILASRWLAQPPTRPRGFQVLPPEEKHE